VERDGDPIQRRWLGLREQLHNADITGLGSGLGGVCPTPALAEFRPFLGGTLAAAEHVLHSDSECKSPVFLGDLTQAME
jgi:hypothetical protein